MIKRFGGFILFGHFSLMAAVVIGLEAYWHTYWRKPPQPIAYNHMKHVTQLQCTGCHRYADRGRRAGVPAVEKCMECHKNPVTQHADQAKIVEHWEQQKPIEWNKVHNLPEFVYFTHKRHIRYFTQKEGVQASDVCQKCHGLVQEMTTARQVKSMDMGFCVSCHRQNNAPIGCWTCHQ